MRNLLANTICALHFIAVLWIVGGAAALMFWKPLWPFVVITAFLVVIANDNGRGCILTRLENELRSEEAYPGPCTVHYAQQWFGINLPETALTWVYGGCCFIALCRWLKLS